MGDQPSASFFARVEVIACNDYGYCNTAFTPGLLIDKDPPAPGFVSHSFEVHHPSEWEEVLQIACIEDGVCQVVALPLYSRPFASDLIKHEVTPTDAAMTGFVGADAVVSWGDFADPHSGLARAELCCGSGPGLADVMPCTAVPLSGRAILLGLGVAHLQTSYVTIHVWDHAGNTVDSRSLGIQFFIERVIPSSPTHPSPFLLSCGVVPTSWTAMQDDCDSPLHLSIALCDATGVCSGDGYPAIRTYLLY